MAATTVMTDATTKPVEESDEDSEIRAGKNNAIKMQRILQKNILKQTNGDITALEGTDMFYDPAMDIELANNEVKRQIEREHRATEHERCGSVELDEPQYMYLGVKESMRQINGQKYIRAKEYGGGAKTGEKNKKVCIFILFFLFNFISGFIIFFLVFSVSIYISCK